MTISDLAQNFDYFMMGDCSMWKDNVEIPPLRMKARGFTIGKGKKLYWFITPNKCGTYRCLGYEEGDTLGWPRNVENNQEITIHYHGIN